MKLVGVIALLALFYSDVFASPERTVGETPKTEEDVRKSWMNTYSNLKHHVSLAFTIMQPVLHRFMKEPNITKECLQSTAMLVSSVRQGKAWAFKILDSWGKLPSGLLTGVLTDLGSYYECHDAAADVIRLFGEKGRYLSPHYCILDYRLTLPIKEYKISSYDLMPDFLNLTAKDTVIQLIANLSHVFRYETIRIGMCVPSSCNTFDTQRFYKLVFHHIGIGGTVEVPHCESELPRTLNTRQKLSVALIALLLLMLILGTVLDIHWQRNDDIFSDSATSTIKEVFLSFSIHSNMKKVFQVRRTPQMLSVLHGIRVMSLLWIIVCHSYLYVDLQMVASVYGFKDFFKKYSFQFVVNGTPSVDTFFFLSGLLVCYSTIKVVKESKCGIHIPAFVLYRFFRLSPTYVLVIACVFILPLMSSGPVWDITLRPEIEKCRRNWWTNILFINNFINSENGCLDHSWYLAADTQLYVCSLLVLLPLVRWPAVGLTVNFVLIVLTAGVTAFLNVYMNLPPTALSALYSNASDRLADWSEVYYKPYPHAGAYCIGMATGYLCATKHRLKLRKCTLILGWVFTVTTSACVLFSTRDWNLGHRPPRWVSALYSGTSRTAWALCVAWVTITCVYGYGGIVDRILSSKIFIPFSRVCYSTYLIHPLVQWIYNAKRNERIYPSHYLWTYMVIGHTVISFGTAFLCSVVAESPFLALQKIIFKSRRARSSISQESSSNQDFIAENELKKKNDNISILHPMAYSNKGFEKSSINYVCRL